ncbi:hypothetical protein [Baekduia sp. Peel2402]|uniref:hypothetical protein n=1 Tax=Baekduia sp. Peel2402 TaxID=3458296 RepID=UPI00403E6E75
MAGDSASPSMKNFTLPRARTLVALILTAFPVAGTLSYFVLSVLHQHVYGSLDVTTAEVGINRAKMIDDTVAGVSFLLVALPALVLIGWLVAEVLVRVLPWIVQRVLRSIPRSANGRLARWLRRRTTSTRPSQRFMLAWISAFVAASTILALGVLWTAAGTAARYTQDGYSYSGRLFWGFRALDFEGVPFRFTKIPPDHHFDRSCVLYLGRANGQLVLYDTYADAPLRLQESRYQGEALDPDQHLLPRHCLNDRPEQGVLITATQIDDLDSVPGTLVWTMRPHPSAAWELLAQTDVGPKLLARSDRPMEADLGRTHGGRLVVTYRSCRQRRCASMERDLVRGPAHRLQGPARPGCEVAQMVTHREIVAARLAGPECPAADRGVWARARRASWRRVTATDAAIVDMEAYGRRVAWIERRDPFITVRAAVIGPSRSTMQRETLFEDTTMLHGGSPLLRSLHLTRDGTWWLRAIEHGRYPAIISRGLNSDDCQEAWDPLVEVDNLREISISGRAMFVATGHTIRRLAVEDEPLGGDRVPVPSADEIAGTRCPAR